MSAASADGGLAVATLAGLGGMAGWGVADFLAKKTIDRIGDLTTLFWAQAIGIAPLLGIFAVSRHVPTLHAYDLLWLVLLGAASALSYLSLYAGFGKGQVSFLSPVFAAHAALVVILSAWVFDEDIATRQWIAIAVVIVGVVVISTNLSELSHVLHDTATSRTGGLAQTLTAAVAYALWLVLLNRFIGERDWVFFLLVIRAAAAGTLIAFARGTRRSFGLGPTADRRAVAPYLLVIGASDVAAFAAVAYGFSATTHTSIVAVLSATFSLPTLLLARIFLKERLVRSQKLAAGVILVGIAAVSIYS